MIPILPFVAGLVAGGLAIRAWRSEETRAGVRKAQDALLSAAQSGVTTLRTATGELRQRLVGEAGESVGTGKSAPVVAPKKPRRKAADAARPATTGTRKTAGRAKAAPATPAAETTAAAKRKPATRKRKPAASQGEAA